MRLKIQMLRFWFYEKNHVITVVYSSKIANTVLVLEVCCISCFRQKMLIMMPAYDKEQ